VKRCPQTSSDCCRSALIAQGFDAGGSVYAFDRALWRGVGRSVRRNVVCGERRPTRVAAYLTALKGASADRQHEGEARGPDAAAGADRAVDRRESSPIREVELVQQRLDIDAQLAQIDQAARLPELEKAFVDVAASWAERSGVSAAALREVGVTGPR
jgi:hypothetical protein